MYCIKCGVRLEDTEKVCPLCKTSVYHPELEIRIAEPLYPIGKRPKVKPRSRAICGAIIFLFLIPLFVSFISDLQGDGRLSWFFFVCGALLLGYIAFGLPLWFRRPNPVIFVPIDLVGCGLYLLFICEYTGGDWFLSFVFPILGAFGLIVCALVTLLRYLRKGKLYIWGGAFIAMGGLMLLLEFLLDITFGFSYIGWSVYPLIVFVLLGGIMIYLAINSTAREIMERKLFL